LTDLFFDLDGTLTDSREGIVRCIEHALSELGCDVPPSSALLRFVGPPLHVSFAELLGSADPERVTQALGAYRSRFETIGIFENTLWPGIREALDDLSDAGHRLYVVTSKPTVYARRILAHFGISRYFIDVFGPELTSRNHDKTSLLRNALEAAGGSAASSVMIGDRAEDIVGARHNGVRSLAVAWGYGEQAELESAAPDAIVHSVAALVAHLQAAT
jgi:phosphoglycolate phosphatase